MTDVFIGTSGWSYGWNLDNSLEWYINESGLNAIELNMSYYRFPFPNMVKSWAKKGRSLAWVIKVHRSITHYKKLDKEIYSIFKKFKTQFSPLEESIHYYLFQFPPKFTDIDLLQRFIEEFGGEKIAVEFRNNKMFTDEIIRWGKKQKVLIVSIDAPKLPTKIMSKEVVYERIHGRNHWYSHNYNNRELLEIKERVLNNTPEKVYVFFNNNHAMLENGRTLFNYLK